MAPKETTTLRVPSVLRDEIARLAEARGTTMLGVVTEAIHQLSRDEWWSTVHRALDDASEANLASYRDETGRLDGATPDGLDESAPGDH